MQVSTALEPQCPASFEYKKHISVSKYPVTAGCFNRKHQHVFTTDGHNLRLCSLTGTLHSKTLGKLYNITWVGYNDNLDLYFALWNGIYMMVLDANFETIQHKWMVHNRRVSGHTIHQKHDHLIVGSSEGVLSCWWFGWERRLQSSDDFEGKITFVTEKKWQSAEGLIETCGYLYLDEHGDVLYVASQNSVYMFNANTGEKMCDFGALADGQIVYMDFQRTRNHEEFFSTGTRQGQVKVWKIQEKNAAYVCTLGGHDGMIHAMAFDPRGTSIFTSGNDKKMRHWHFDSVKGMRLADQVDPEHTSMANKSGKMYGRKEGFVWMTHLSTEKNDFLLALAETHLYLYEIHSFLKFFSLSSAQIHSVLVSKELRLPNPPHILSLTVNSDLQIMDSQTGQITSISTLRSKERVPEVENGSASLASPMVQQMKRESDRMLIERSKADTHYINLNIRPSSFTAEVSIMTSSPLLPNLIILGWANGSLDIYDPVSKKILVEAKYRAFSGAITTIAVYVDKTAERNQGRDAAVRVACGTDSGHIIVWQLYPVVNMSRLFGAANSFIVKVEYIEEKNCCVVAETDGFIKVYNVENWTQDICFHTRNGSRSLLTAIGFTRRGCAIIGYSSGVVELVRMHYGRKLPMFGVSPLQEHDEVHEGMVTSINLTEDGRIACSSGSDGVIAIWNASNLQILKTYRSRVPVTSSVPYSKNGNVLLCMGGFFNCIPLAITKSMTNNAKLHDFPRPAKITRLTKEEEKIRQKEEAVELQRTIDDWLRRTKQKNTIKEMRRSYAQNVVGVTFINRHHDLQNYINGDGGENSDWKEMLKTTKTKIFEMQREMHSDHVARMVENAGAILSFEGYVARAKVRANIHKGKLALTPRHAAMSHEELDEYWKGFIRDSMLDEGAMEEMRREAESQLSEKDRVEEEPQGAAEGEAEAGVEVGAELQVDVYEEDSQKDLVLSGTVLDHKPHSAPMLPPLELSSNHVGGGRRMPPLDPVREIRPRSQQQAVARIHSKPALRSRSLPTWQDVEKKQKAPEYSFPKNVEVPRGPRAIELLDETERLEQMYPYSADFRLSADQGLLPPQRERGRRGKTRKPAKRSQSALDSFPTSRYPMTPSFDRPDRAMRSESTVSRTRALGSPDPWVILRPLSRASITTEKIPPFPSQLAPPHPVGNPRVFGPRLAMSPTVAGLSTRVSLDPKLPVADAGSAELNLGLTWQSNVLSDMIGFPADRLASPPASSYGSIRKNLQGEGRAVSRQAQLWAESSVNLGGGGSEEEDGGEDDDEEGEGGEGGAEHEEEQKS